MLRRPSYGARIAILIDGDMTIEADSPWGGDGNYKKPGFFMGIFISQALLVLNLVTSRLGWGVLL